MHDYPEKLDGVQNLTDAKRDRKEDHFQYKTIDRKSAFHSPDSMPATAHNKNAMSVRTSQSEVVTQQQRSRQALHKVRTGYYVMTGGEDLYRSLELLYWRHQNSTVTKN